MLREKRSKSFANGTVFAFLNDYGYPLEVTETFLPTYTQYAINRNQNCLTSQDLGNRTNRWMIGISCMSGCPVRCRFCATGQLKYFTYLTADDMTDQVFEMLNRHPEIDPNECDEFKINYTRMGEPFLNIEAVRECIDRISARYPRTHHYISTIGIKDSDFSWITGNVSLQISLHSLDKERRNWLIPFPNKMTIEELGQIRTQSNLKTTVNLTLVDQADFDIKRLQQYFDPEYFFIKLSPINTNATSIRNNLGKGIIQQTNLL